MKPIDASQAYRVFESWKERGTIIRCNSMKPDSFDFCISIKGSVFSLSRDRVTMLIEGSDNLFQLSLKESSFEELETPEEVVDFASYAHHVVAKDASGRFILFSEMDSIFPERRRS